MRLTSGQALHQLGQFWKPGRHEMAVGQEYPMALLDAGLNQSGCHRSLQETSQALTLQPMLVANGRKSQACKRSVLSTLRTSFLQVGSSNSPKALSAEAFDAVAAADDMLMT